MRPMMMSSSSKKKKKKEDLCVSSLPPQGDQSFCRRRLESLERTLKIASTRSAMFASDIRAANARLARLNHALSSHRNKQLLLIPPHHRRTNSMDATTMSQSKTREGHDHCAITTMSEAEKERLPPHQRTNSIDATTITTTTAQAKRREGHDHCAITTMSEAEKENAHPEKEENEEETLARVSSRARTRLILAERDVCRQHLDVIRLEQTLCALQTSETTMLLTRARREEVATLTRTLTTVGDAIRVVRRYAEIASDPTRNEFFFADCQQRWGLGRWYCACLSQRSSWSRYPSEKWFRTKRGVQLYAPVGRATVDFTDQSVYSLVESCVFGTEWMTNSDRLASIAPSGVVPPTWRLRADGRWFDDREPPPTRSDVVWFVKDLDRNVANGASVHASLDECLRCTRRGRRYVLQQHYADPMLLDPRSGAPARPGETGHKFHVRFYAFVYSPPNEVAIRLYTCKSHGWICMAKEAWRPTRASRDVQITRRRSTRATTWSEWDTAYVDMARMTRDLVENVASRFEVHETKASFELLGMDFVLSANERVTLLDVIAGPRVTNEDKPMLRGVLDICIPWGRDESSPSSVSWERTNINAKPRLRKRGVPARRTP